MKLQDAYVAETGAYIGDWSKIGYQAPGATSSTATTGTTSNFTYEQAGSYTDNTAQLTSSAIEVWKATNLLKLNDCAGSAANWGLKVTGGTSGTYTWSTHMGTNCDLLTPSFKNLGTTTY